jgi:decaprenyl-phosphate phosphoribosyltransferase
VSRREVRCTAIARIGPTAPPSEEAATDIEVGLPHVPARRITRPENGRTQPQPAERAGRRSGLPPKALCRRRLALGALVRACRPRQWVKNVLVVAAPAAAGILTRPDVAGKVVVAFLCFCMLSSATYLLNDVRDREQDRHDPARHRRPIAAGELSVCAALAAAAALALGGLSLAFAVRPALAGAGAGYLALTTGYSLWWRRVAVADIAAVAGGFVLRALAGGAATAVPVSRWFMLVTSFGALFLVAGKRYAELMATGHDGAVRRASLQSYSERYLRFVLGLAATVTTTGYCLWAFQRAHSAKLSWYELTVVPFVLWLLRYALLLDGGEGRTPEALVLRDRFLLSMSVAWLVVFAVGVYVAG